MGQGVYLESPAYRLKAEEARFNQREALLKGFLATPCPCGEDVRLSMGEARFDVATGELVGEASLGLWNLEIPIGEARANADFKGLRAERALALFAEEVVVLKGKVQADSPRLQAETLVVDLKGREALALGSFTYQEGKATLRGQGASARLHLRFQSGKVLASTRVPEGALRLVAYASRLP
ncbi:hypothetical protein [Thermus thalpophilus]|uniref:hypothetical protein n=1 Tax=Thermus thalpophilus TaxID=2908147 RepID=UPI001FA9BC87|nr:hypothetical protein [Thermus thalpophilus]